MLENRLVVSIFLTARRSVSRLPLMHFSSHTDPQLPLPIFFCRFQCSVLETTRRLEVGLDSSYVWIVSFKLGTNVVLSLESRTRSGIRAIFRPGRVSGPGVAMIARSHAYLRLSVVFPCGGTNEPRSLHITCRPSGS